MPGYLPFSKTDGQEMWVKMITSELTRSLLWQLPNSTFCLNHEN